MKSSIVTVAQAVSAIQQLKDTGCTIGTIIANGYLLPALMVSGCYSTQELRVAGVSIADLKGACYTAADIKLTQSLGADLRVSGYTAVCTKVASFSAAELRNAGYSILSPSSMPLDTSPLLIPIMPLQCYKIPRCWLLI